MNGRARFAYAQARLQARHGQRPTSLDWRRLASAGTLDNFVQATRRSPLRHWTQGLHSRHSSHDIERHLRMQYQRYVGEVALWLPVPWQASLNWIRGLPYLPALQYLRDSNDPPGWMLADPMLQAIARAGGNNRLEALLNSEFAPLASAWRQDSTLPDAWIRHWQQGWPKDKTQQPGLTCLSGLLHRFIQARQADESARSPDHTLTLASALQYAFRRFSFQPACAIAHLGLVSLDLQRLRGELVYRTLFDGDRTVHA